MPVAVPEVPRLLVPQARILKALMPIDPALPKSEWPLLTRGAMAVRAGYTTISGSVTRALIGIHPGSSSGRPHLGIMPLGLAETVELDIDGVKEVSYRITRLGIVAFHRFISHGGKLPEERHREARTNRRYKEALPGSEVTSHASS